MISLGDQLLNDPNFQHNLQIKKLEIEIRFGTLRKRQLYGQNIVYGLMSAQNFLIMTPESVQQINNASSLQQLNQIQFEKLKPPQQSNPEERLQRFDAMTDEATFKHVKRTLDNLKNTEFNSNFGVIHFLQYNFQPKGLPYTLRKRYLVDEASYNQGSDGRGKLQECVAKFSLNKLDVCNGQLRTDYRIAQSVEINIPEHEFDENQHGVEFSERERYTYEFKLQNILMTYDLTVIKPNQNSYDEYLYAVELEFSAIDGQYNQALINKIITEADAIALLMQDYLDVEYAGDEESSSSTYEYTMSQSY